MNWIEVIKQEKRKNAGTWSLCILLTVAVGIIQSFVLDVFAQKNSGGSLKGRIQADYACYYYFWEWYF